MKGELGIQFMIGIMITMLVGAAIFVPLIFSTATTATVPQASVNEPITCANATTVYLKGALTSGTIVLRNATGVLIASGNYTVASATYRHLATVTFKFSSASYYTTTGCHVNYTYYDPSYDPSSTNRTLIALLPLLAAIVLIVILVAYLKT